MQVSVFDTYVTRTDGTLMHFDILVPSNVTCTDTIHQYGQTYLATKGQAGQPLTAKECQFCHIEQATEEVQTSITNQGFHIIEMQGCY
ncbi:hypothetical protein BWI93_02570 [Siphonobacter sp. BAB-5385]|uniref:DUF2024 family protein n=1 Tax=unclassified Siphonobacter TaxID=2635712 RepID=UPI000B9EC72A|nr:MULTISPECIES: DUF2024 family protein [unclassified Siphonobacter]OZI09768.1 hypothetical protein BWI93_02570 [Siphonobacter sp. BAB-5385]PMD92362.1 hypothetical protein BWI97_19895 [Siphonobacter sp. BAB-5405]